jgi:hypothetical protein
MLKFEWNALHVADKVLVHDPGSARLALTSGVVAMIDTHKGTSSVGIRVAAPGGERVILWPSYLAVHRDPRDPTEPCWRCQALASSGEVTAGVG